MAGVDHPHPSDASGSLGEATPAFWARIEEILDALSGVGPDRIDVEIERACDGDPALAREVRSLLAHLPDPEEPDPHALDVDLEGLDPESLIGRDLGGFEIESIVGRGGHGVVYRAMQARPRRAVAVKVVESPSLRFARARTAILTRFEREVESLAAVDHPGVARILAAGIDGSTGRPLPFLVTEFVEKARDLVAWWTATASRPLSARLGLVADVVDAVQAAHGVGILHRDLKPANILVDVDDRPKVIDFGIAGVLDGRRRATDDLRGGSVGYASPEQLSGDEVSVRSDVYALGRVLQSCLESAPPEASLDPATRRAARDLRAIVARACEDEPRHRYSTAAALADDLRRVARGIPADAAMPTAWRRLLAGLRRRPGLSSAGLGAAATIVALLVFAMISWRLAERAERRLAIENERLEAARYRELLTLAALALDDPTQARRALDTIGPDHDDLAIRLLRHRFAEGGDAVTGKGLNAYRLRALADGSVVSGTARRSVHLFPRGSAEPDFEATDLPEQVYGVGTSLDGRSIVAGTSAGTLHRWRLDEDGRVIESSLVLDDAIVTLAVGHHPTEPIAAIVDGRGRLRMIDLDRELESDDRETTPVDDVDTAWCDVDFSADGRRIVVSGLRSGIVLLERVAEGWREIGRLNPDHMVRKVRFSPGGDRIAIAGGRMLTIVDTDGLRIRGRAVPREWPVWSVGWSPAGDRLAIGGWGQEVQLLDAGSLAVVRTLLGADGPIWAIAWPEDDLLATGEENATVRWWPVGTGETRSWSLPESPMGLTLDDHGDVVVSDDSGALRRLRCDGSIETLVESVDDLHRSVVVPAGFASIRGDRLRWHALDGSLRSTAVLAAPVESVDWLVPSPDGRWVGGVLDGHRVVVIETSTGRIIHDRVLESGLPSRGWWDDRGRYVLPRRWTASSEEIATEWRLDPTGGEVSGPPNRIRRNIRTSLDVPGGWLAAMTTDDEFSLFLGDGDAPYARADQAHGGGVDHLSIVDGGATVVSAGVDGLVRVWAMPGLEHLHTIRSRPASPVTTMAVVDDVAVLVGHRDGTVNRFVAVPPDR